MGADNRGSAGSLFTVVGSWTLLHAAASHTVPAHDGPRGGSYTEFVDGSASCPREKVGEYLDGLFVVGYE